MPKKIVRLLYRSQSIPPGGGEAGHELPGQLLDLLEERYGIPGLEVLRLAQQAVQRRQGRDITAEDGKHYERVLCEKSC